MSGVSLSEVYVCAALKVNTELLNFYWELGADIVTRQEKTSWGDGFLLQLSKDLMAEFPNMKGFSRTNLLYMRKWYLFYRCTSGNVPQIVGQMEPVKIKEILQIPWGHNYAFIHVKLPDLRLFNLQKKAIVGPGEFFTDNW